MSCGIQQNIEICQGKTFRLSFRVPGEPDFLPITNITQAAPAVLTVASHGLSDGWKVALEDVQGMTEINSPVTPSRTTDYWDVVVIDADHISLSKAGNLLNSISYSAYVSGGVLRYSKPQDLTGAAVRMAVKNADGDVIATTDGNTPNITATITIEECRVELEMTATDTALLAAMTGGTHASEIEYPDGTVDGCMYGAATVDVEAI